MMKKNDETKYSIEPAKPSPSAGAQIEIAIFAYIAEVIIVATKYPVFPNAQVPSSLSSIYTPRKTSPISAVTLFATRSPVEFVTRRPIDNGK